MALQYSPIVFLPPFASQFLLLISLQFALEPAEGYWTSLWLLMLLYPFYGVAVWILVREQVL